MMRPQMFVKRMFPVVYLLPTLLIIVMLNLGGISAAGRDVPINPTPQSSDGLRGIPVIDAVRSGDISAPQAFTGCANVTEIPKKECQALVKLYNATNGPGWDDSIGWLQTDQPCGWEGITCAANHVTVIDLNSNKLVGTIPVELGNLEDLQELDLSENRLSGAIPPQLGNLTDLLILDLSLNRLSGQLPTELSQLVSLTQLILTGNRLSGAVPAGLTQLTSLQALELSSNQLSGTIPTNIGQMTSLLYLVLSENQFSGSIPTSIGQMTNLEILFLENNQLSGIIPPELGQLNNLRQIWLNDNQLSGTIPIELGQITGLLDLQLANNQLSGIIPPELAQIPDLLRLTVGNNQLSGMIPPELGQLDSLGTLDLANNQLSGPIPAELGQLDILLRLWMGGNKLSGPIPPEFANLSGLLELDLAHNALTATDAGVLAFLNTDFPGWDEAQTVPPTNVDVIVGTSQELIVSWTSIATPLPYLEKGHYEVGCGITSGEYDLYFLYTANMYTSQATFSALPDGTYYCAVRTFTPAHNDNDNDVWSDWSAEDTGTVTGATTVQGDEFTEPVIVSNLNSQFWSLNAAAAEPDADFPAPSCMPELDPEVTPGIFFQLPVDLSGDIAVIAGGPRYFKDRDPDIVDTVLAIYTGDTLQTLVEVACDDDGGPSGGGSRINLSAFAPGTTYSAVVWLHDAGIDDAGTDGMVFEVSQTEILSINGDFTTANPNNAKLPLKWKAKNLGSGKLLCDVGNQNRAYSPPCAFQMVAGAKAPVLQQTLKSVDFPEPISKGTFQVAAYLKRLGTTGKTQVAFQVNFTDGKKVTKKRQRPAGNSGGDYELVLSPLFRIKKEVASVRVYVRLEGKKGKVRVDDVKLYYIP